MTQMQTPLPPPAGQPAQYQGAGDELTGPTPWSALAISAFVCALLGFLGVTAILGIILGIAGIIVTKSGKRRGMGLSIAAIPISIVTGLISIGLIVGLLLMAKIGTTVAAILPIFDAGASDRPQAMAEFRKFTSQSFDEAVSDEQFFSWVDQVVKENGKLTEISARLGQGGPQPQVGKDDEGRMTLSIPAKFINGPATIRIIFNQEGLSDAKLDDITVGGVSPRGSP